MLFSLLVLWLLASKIFLEHIQIALNVMTDSSFLVHSERPWLHDDLDAWLSRQQQTPYKCAIIFLDNSGCDVVLGIIPFARELLMRGTRVRFPLISIGLV